jgi:hypothetical protein
VSGTAATHPDAEGLERALREAGLPCVVDAFDRLAVIVPGPDGVELGDASLRRRALALLPHYGFTHLALELTGPSSREPGENLHRD